VANRESQSRRRVLVIGLDGATWDNLLPLVESGSLPVLKSLIESGCWGVLRSTLPCVTPPAWGSFLTGASPARHGVLDFTRRLDSDLFEFVTSRDLQVPGLWHVLSHCGRRGVFAGIPFTHPPDPIDGVIVPGPPVPSGGIETWPPELAARIAEKIPGYTAELPRTGRSRVLGEIDRATENRRALARWLMEEEAWDFFMVTFIATDRLHHHMWHQKEIVDGYYRRLDGVLGDLLAGAGSDTCVVLMSDHGFASMRTRFFPNQWLADRGYLTARFVRTARAWDPRHMNPTARRSSSRGTVYGWRKLLRLLPGCGNYRWVIDLEKTRAFSSFGHLTGVFVNLEGRYRHGIVKPGKEYESLRDDLIRDLSAVREPGTGAAGIFGRSAAGVLGRSAAGVLGRSAAGVFSRVARREEMFSGPAVERMPDVICETGDPAIRLRSNLGLRGTFAPFRKKKSYHAPDGIFCARGPGIRQGGRIPAAGIQDVAPLILRLMGLPRLSTMDGKVPDGVLDPAFFTARELPVLPAEEIDFVKGKGALSAGDRAAVRGDLEALGYL